MLKSKVTYSEFKVYCRYLDFKKFEHINPFSLPLVIPGAHPSLSWAKGMKTLVGQFQA